MRRAAYVVGAMLLVALIVLAGIGGCTANRPAPAPGYFGPSTIGGLRASESVLSSPAIAMPPGSTPDRSDELWVIERSQPAAAAAGEDKMPGTGVLLAKPDQASDKTVPMPLKHTDVKASITGYIASVDVTQQYQNPYDTKIEAVYVFPLPHNAAITDFVMTIGERKIRGIIRERAEAEKIYQEAKSQGYVATLMTQERPNIFTQSVANIEPGKQIDVSIRYFHTLAYVDGSYEFVFPMVVGPRFNPPGSTDGVGAVGRGSAGISGQKTEVPYLRPGERSGHDISLSVDVDAGVAIEKLVSVNHLINTTWAGEQGTKRRSDEATKAAEMAAEGTEARSAHVILAAGDTLPNKDFVLRYQIAGKTIKSAGFAARDKRGGYFTLMLVPPASLADVSRQPVEMVFTLDTSGSMSGRPIEQSKAAMRYALAHMNAADTFQIIRFGNYAEKLSAAPLPATPENLRLAVRYIDSTQGGGGTMMVDGMRASLNFPHDETHLRYVAFLTDGFIGNESEVLREVHDNLGPARIFSFGVGSSPNRYLLEHMAKMGNGAAAFLSLNDNADEVMGQFFERTSHPAMTDITLDAGTAQLADVYPQRIPDLFVGRPVILTGRFNGIAPSSIRVTGRLAGHLTTIDVPLNPDDPAASTKALPAIWARSKIADLCDRAVWEKNDRLPDQVKQLALEYGLMSPFTAFIAVDATTRTQGPYGVTVPVAVPVPDGVKYETTVEEGRREVRKQNDE